MKKILITGGNGFIGRNLKENLKGKYTIYSPNRYELDLLNQDEVERYLKDYEIDIVIHSAIQDTLGEKSIFEDKALDRNLRMFFNIQRCSSLYDKMYYFGSGAEYDRENYIPNMNEKYFGKSIPKDPYGFSKYIMNTISEKSDNIYNLRLFGVFGKYEKYEHRFISNSIYKAIQGNDIIIRQNVYFDYLYIDDLCNIMEWFIENKPKYKSYNVCTNDSIDLISIARIIKQISNKEFDIKILNEGLNKEYTGDNSRLLDELGKYEFRDIENSVNDLYEYYKSKFKIEE